MINVAVNISLTDLLLSRGRILLPAKAPRRTPKAVADARNGWM
jgi:hypothetical protein